MNTLAVLKPLTARLLDIQRINSAASVLSWDQETYMPAAGGLARADQIATVQGLAHQQLIARETEQLLCRWVDRDSGHLIEANGERWDEPSRALLREVWRDFNRARKLPPEFVIRLSRECSLAQQVWMEARKECNFKTFLPSLRTILALKREEAEYTGYSDSPYNALLDTYEPGVTIAFLRPLFDRLRSRLVPLLQAIAARSNKIDDGFLYRSYDTGRQVEFGRLILMAMGYDFERGRLDLSAHPFTTSFHPTDVRVTTRVYQHELPVCLFSCLHEGGHGLYEQGLDTDHYGTPLGEPVSLGIHESQSRLWENCVGRSLPFWKFFYPILQHTFPDQLKAIDTEGFYRAINRVKPSLIRVEADELTYNLHIMLRVELEQDLIENRFPLEDLPERWRDGMRTYLGITPEGDADGVLQDVHWAMGSFGYFPTYTLGNLYAVQIFEQVKREIIHLEDDIASGQLVALRRWLAQKIHRWGRTFPPERLAERVTGTGLSTEPFLRYIEHKYAQLYDLPVPSTTVSSD